MVFEPDGVWSDLVTRVGGFIRSEVRQESTDERQYRVLDFWKSHLDFEFFRWRFQAECEKFDQLLQLEGLVEKQQLVGTYYLDDSSGTEEVPAFS